MLICIHIHVCYISLSVYMFFDPSNNAATFNVYLKLATFYAGLGFPVQKYSYFKSHINFWLAST